MFVIVVIFWVNNLNDQNMKEEERRKSKKKITLNSIGKSTSGSRVVVPVNSQINCITQIK